MRSNTGEKPSASLRNGSGKCLSIDAKSNPKGSLPGALAPSPNGIAGAIGSDMGSAVLGFAAGMPFDASNTILPNVQLTAVPLIVSTLWKIGFGISPSSNPNFSTFSSSAFNSPPTVLVPSS